MDFALPLAPTFVKAWRNLLKRGVMGGLCWLACRW